RPQTKLNLLLLWCIFMHRASNPRHLFRAQLGGATRDGFGQQGVLPTLNERRQPAKNAALVHAESRSNAAERLDLAHRRDGLLTHHLQSVVVVSPTVGCALAFHVSDYKPT